MNEQKKYTIREAADMLNISPHTLQRWYHWQMRELTEGVIEEEYLPKPERLKSKRGAPNVWTSEQIEELRKHKESIVVGRNGRYGKYTNPQHHEKEN